MRLIKTNQPCHINIDYQATVNFLPNIQYLVPEEYEKILEPYISDSEFYIELNQYYDNLNSKSLLVYRHGGIGDCIFISTALRELKKKYPESELFFACNQAFHKLLECEEFTLISTPVTVEFMETMDYVKGVQGLLEGPLSDAEMVDAYTLTCKHLKAEYTGLLPHVNTESIDMGLIKMFKGFDWVTMQIMATAKVRSIPFELAIDIIHNLPTKYKVMLVCSDAQIPVHEQLVSQMPKDLQDKVYLISKVVKPIEKIAHVISLSKFVIAPDSAILHIAGALQIPMIGLFGAFPSALRIGHYKKAIALDSNTQCEFARGQYRSCFEHSAGPCSLAQKTYSFSSPCMDLISVDMVMGAVKVIEGANHGRG